MIITANIKSRKCKKKTNNKQQQEALKGKENNASYCFEEGSCVFLEVTPTVSMKRTRPATPHSHTRTPSGSHRHTWE